MNVEKAGETQKVRVRTLVDSVRQRIPGLEQYIQFVDGYQEYVLDMTAKVWHFPKRSISILLQNILLITKTLRRCEADQSWHVTNLKLTWQNFHNTHTIMLAIVVAG